MHDRITEVVNNHCPELCIPNHQRKEVFELHKGWSIPDVRPMPFPIWLWAKTESGIAAPVTRNTWCSPYVRESSIVWIGMMSKHDSHDAEDLPLMTPNSRVLLKG